jgi:signal transduction histidine kinase
MDDPANCAPVRSILTRGGYTVLETSTAAGILAKALEVRPQLIVLGKDIPDQIRLEVCRALQSDLGVASIPILLMTAGRDDAAAVASLQAGADDCVADDSAPELVLARTERLVRYHRLLSMTTLDRQLVQVGRLLAGVVHEIRGPLSVIRGSAELLRLGKSADDPDLPWVDSILRGTQLLQARLDHLMSAVRSGSPQLETLELQPVVQEATDLFIKGLPPNHRGVQILCECGQAVPEVRADAGRLIQVLINLFTNAYQAIAREGMTGTIRIRAEQAGEEGTDWVKILVIDDGPGIPGDYLERIFEPFFTTREGGSGFGLYLCSEILKEQGGRLEACNNPDGGACLTIWLPQVDRDRTGESAAWDG